MREPNRVKGSPDRKSSSLTTPRVTLAWHIGLLWGCVCRGREGRWGLLAVGFSHGVVASRGGSRAGVGMNMTRLWGLVHQC